MRKLQLLKMIIDFVWIISLVFYPLLLVFMVMVFMGNNFSAIPITFFGENVSLTNVFGKLAFLFQVLNFGVLLFIVYFLKKLLRNFQNRLIFEKQSISYLNAIGSALLISSCLYLISNFLLKIAQGAFELQLGYGSFLSLLATGLFFKMLSEVFTTGKELKEENNLTI